MYFVVRPLIVTLHEVVTPESPVCKVFSYSSSWQLPGRGDITTQLTVLARQHVIHGTDLWTPPALSFGVHFCIQSFSVLS